MRPRRRGESGAALVMALLVLFLLSVALALLAESLQIRMRLTRDEAESVTLQSLSDSAVEEAMAELALDAGYSGTPAHPFGGGTIGTQVQPVTTTVYEVTATAVYAGHHRVVEAEVVRDTSGVAVRRWRRVPG